MGNAVVHFEVEGRDGDGLRTFYSGMFGWQIDANNPAGYGMVTRDENVNVDGVGIGGGIYEMPETPAPSWHGPSRAEGYAGHVTVYVEVDDVEAELAQAEILGGSRMQEPDEVMGGLMMGKFTDPEGHLIGLISRSPQATE